jgi:hypothetical protein
MSASDEFDGDFRTCVAQYRQKDSFKMFERRTPPDVRPAVDTKLGIAVGVESGRKDGVRDERNRTCGTHLNLVLSASRCVFSGFEDDTVRTLFVALYRRVRHIGESMDTGEMLRLQTGFVAVRTDVIDY